MKLITIDRRTRVDDLPELLRVEEAAAVLGISRGLVYELCRRGELESCRLGRLLRIKRSAVAARTAVAD
jgi:excisionase family DNA binding protein